jgi:hypothetical protein
MEHPNAAGYGPGMNQERKRLTTRRVVAILCTAILGVALTGAVAQPAAAVPAPTPQWSYKMVSVYKSATRAKSSKISSEVCNPTGQSTTASYAASTERSNTFSVTGGLNFAKLASMLGGQISVTGSITESTTITQTLTTTVPSHRCMAVYQLRDRYTYTLQKKCNYACNTGTRDWKSVGTGTYSKFIGRAYYYTN